MTKWKDLHDTNPEPNLLDAIAHAEKQPEKKANEEETEEEQPE